MSYIVVLKCECPTLPSEDTLKEIAERIEERTGGLITKENVIFVKDVPG